MALPEVPDLRAHLRLVTSAEDDSLQDALLDAVAAVETYIGQPIEAREVTMTVTPTWAGGNTYARRLVLPYARVGSITSVLHDDGTPLYDLVDYTFSPVLGRLTSLGGGVGFDDVPYTITATVGLSLLPDYEARVERVMRRAILLMAADFFLRRNPAAIYESSGGGAATTYAPGATENVPAPIRTLLDPFRRVLV